MSAYSSSSISSRRYFVEKVPSSLAPYSEVKDISYTAIIHSPLAETLLKVKDAPTVAFSVDEVADPV